ncbi:PREDICTED: WD repeat-containing protein 59-like [Priapulus caudatus]|uniref:WD repeat-containing protein 59-like n=1 Tax=Priapulus caudatus TaxID=37621 RepID=A0ABM1EQC8_PRICU|nr:PREDICTED: WD repeat-containing protein 59-like [Priapulus caudatus]
MVQIISLLNSSSQFYLEVKPMLLDPDVTAQHDAYKHAYANVLYYWKLHERRIEVLNFVSSATEQHRGVEVQTLCHHCGEKNATGGPQCSHCKHYAFRCSVCHVSVKGPANFCLACYHGGHTYHLMDWFAEQEVCPTGCGCRCLKASTMFADYTASAEH